MTLNDARLLDRVAERILVKWLQRQGHADARTTGGLQSFGGRAVDITYARQGAPVRVKVKADPYFGVDQRKVADRALAFYRGDASSYAFEAVANATTREPGWIFETSADEIFYYYLALGQTVDEVAALAGEPDQVFFSELAVDRDELVILPVGPTRDWFGKAFERYTPRPVMSGGVSAWYRLVPRGDIERDVSGVRAIGPIFGSVSS